MIFSDPFQASAHTFLEAILCRIVTPREHASRTAVPCARQCVARARWGWAIKQLSTRAQTRPRTKHGGQEIEMKMLTSAPRICSSYQPPRWAKHRCCRCCRLHHRPIVLLLLLLLLQACFLYILDDVDIHGHHGRVHSYIGVFLKQLGGALHWTLVQGGRDMLVPWLYEVKHSISSANATSFCSVCGSSSSG